jgi:NAD(P)-dependent dehydrogenase (short-subunit alcohol dehydrogenase family)
VDSGAYDSAARLAGAGGLIKSGGDRDCILITGSSGRIGRAFIDRYHNRFEEFAFDREGPPHPPRAAEHVIPCDMSSDESVKAALAETRRLGGGRIASVLHLDAY